MSLIYGDKMPSIFDASENTIYSKGMSMSKEDEKKLLHIVNDNPLKFETIISKMTTTTTKLAMAINEVFHDMFSDYYGSDVKFANNGPNTGTLTVSLVFKAIPVVEGDTKRAFLPIREKKTTTNDTVNRMMMINTMNSSRHRTMEITPYGMELMYDLMNSQSRKGVNPKNPASFMAITGEMTEQTGMYSTVNNVYCTMIGLDLYRILDVVYGAKDKTEGRYIYKVNPMKPIMMMPGTPAVGQNWVIEIERMTTAAFDKLAREIGATPIPGSISAVTDMAGR